MSTNHELAERLDRLEIRTAHQDAAIDELNEVITAQWKQIDLLKRHVARLEDQASQQPATAGPAQPEPPPPHY